MKVKRFRHTDVVNGATVELWSEACTCQSCVTSVGTSIDGDTLGICNALVYQVLHAFCDIILHLEPPLFVARFEELSAISRTTTEIHLEHSVTTRTKGIVPLRKIPNCREPTDHREDLPLVEAECDCLPKTVVLSQLVEPASIFISATGRMC